FGWPAAAAKTIRLLSTSACAVDGACTQRFKVVLVFGSRLMAGAIRGMPQRTRISLYYKELSGRCTRNAGWIHHAGRRRRAGESCTRPTARRRRGSHANYSVIHFEHRLDGGSTTHSPTPDSYLCRVHG